MDGAGRGYTPSVRRSGVGARDGHREGGDGAVADFSAEGHSIAQRGGAVFGGGGGYGKMHPCVRRQGISHGLCPEDGAQSGCGGVLGDVRVFGGTGGRGVESGQ